MAIVAARVIGAAVAMSLIYCTKIESFVAEGTRQVEEDNAGSPMQYSDNRTSGSFLQLAEQRFDVRNRGRAATVPKEEWSFKHVQVRRDGLVRVSVTLKLTQRSHYIFVSPVQTSTDQSP